MLSQEQKNKIEQFIAEKKDVKTKESDVSVIDPPLRGWPLGRASEQGSVTEKFAAFVDREYKTTDQRRKLSNYLQAMDEDESIRESISLGRKSKLAARGVSFWLIEGLAQSIKMQQLEQSATGLLSPKMRSPYNFHSNLHEKFKDAIGKNDIYVKDLTDAYLGAEIDEEHERKNYEKFCKKFREVVLDKAFDLLKAHPNRFDDLYSATRLQTSDEKNQLTKQAFAEKIYKKLEEEVKYQPIGVVGIDYAKPLVNNLIKINKSLKQVGGNPEAYHEALKNRLYRLVQKEGEERGALFVDILAALGIETDDSYEDMNPVEVKKAGEVLHDQLTRLESENASGRLKFLKREYKKLLDEGGKIGEAQYLKFVNYINQHGITLKLSSKDLEGINMFYQLFDAGLNFSIMPELQEILGGNKNKVDKIKAALREELAFQNYLASKKPAKTALDAKMPEVKEGKTVAAAIPVAPAESKELKAVESFYKHIIALKDEVAATVARDKKAKEKKAREVKLEAKAAKAAKAEKTKSEKELEAYREILKPYEGYRLAEKIKEFPVDKEEGPADFLASVESECQELALKGDDKALIRRAIRDRFFDFVSPGYKGYWSIDDFLRALDIDLDDRAKIAEVLFERLSAFKEFITQNMPEKEGDKKDFCEKTVKALFLAFTQGYKKIENKTSLRQHHIKFVNYVNENAEFLCDSGVGPEDFEKIKTLSKYFLDENSPEDFISEVQKALGGKLNEFDKFQQALLRELEAAKYRVITSNSSGAGVVFYDKNEQFLLDLEEVYSHIHALALDADVQVQELKAGNKDATRAQAQATAYHAIYADYTTYRDDEKNVDLFPEAKPVLEGIFSGVRTPYEKMRDFFKSPSDAGSRVARLSQAARTLLGIEKDNPLEGLEKSGVYVQLASKLWFMMPTLTKTNWEAKWEEKAYTRQNHGKVLQDFFEHKVAWGDVAGKKKQMSLTALFRDRKKHQAAVELALQELELLKKECKVLYGDEEGMGHESLKKGLSLLERKIQELNELLTLLKLGPNHLKTLRTAYETYQAFEAKPEKDREGIRPYPLAAPLKSTGPNVISIQHVGRVALSSSQFAPLQFFAKENRWQSEVKYDFSPKEGRLLSATIYTVKSSKNAPPAQTIAEVPPVGKDNNRVLCEFILRFLFEAIRHMPKEKRANMKFPLKLGNGEEACRAAGYITYVVEKKLGLTCQAVEYEKVISEDNVAKNFEEYLKENPAHLDDFNALKRLFSDDVLKNVDEPMRQVHGVPSSPSKNPK